MIEALIGFAAVLGLVLLRMPIAFAMGLVGMVGYMHLNSFRGAVSMVGRLIIDTTTPDRICDSHGPGFLSRMKLTFLHLGSTKISDAGLPQLEGLKTLKDLKVTRTAVTEAGTSSLQPKLPDTNIQLIYIEGHNC